MGAKVLVSTMDMPRDEWLQWRRKGIGSSDAPAVAGVNPWRSPVEVWAEKTGFQIPQEPSEEAQERMHWGNRLEEVVARDFAERNGVKVRRRRAILQHPEHPVMLANLDRVIAGGQEILEVKTGGERSRSQWFGEDDEAEAIPAWYQIQAQHAMAVTGARATHFAVLIGGQRYLQRYLERDDSLISDLIALEESWWERYVQTGTPPPPDGTNPRADSKILAALYPEGKPEPIALPEEALKIIETYEAWAEAERSAADAKEAAANRLKAMLQGHEVGEVAGRKVRWTTYPTARLNTGALRAAHPEIYQEFSETKTARRFSVA